jgi:pimeloyl-ACP methyl ester carboxylesterase
MARLYRIIYVTGMKPKPPPGEHRAALLRVLIAALRRVRPPAGEWLAAHEDQFTLVSWTHLLHDGTRDIGPDLPGIERLLRSPVAGERERRDIDSLRRRLVRLRRIVGDVFPTVTNLFANAELKQTLADVRRYLGNADGVGDAIRALLESALTAAWRAGERVLVIGHSLGSVIAYDCLWELSRVKRAAGEVEKLVTLGSPLAAWHMRHGLKGADRPEPERYPANIRHWSNFTARGELVALRRLAPHFRGMVACGLIEALEDHVDLYNHFHGTTGIEPHRCYGYLNNERVASVIGVWLAS